MKRLALSSIVLLAALGFSGTAWAEPAWGVNCLSCHGGWQTDTVFILNEDGTADPDESATGAPDRGSLPVFMASPGDTKTLEMELVGLSPEDTYAVELKRLRFLGVVSGKELTYTGDCAWPYWGEPGKYFTEPPISYEWGSDPTAFSFDLTVQPDAPYDYYDLVFAVAGKWAADGGLFYDEQHFYLRVTEIPSAPLAIDEPKNRYISFNAQAVGTSAIQVELVASDPFPGSSGMLGWVEEPDANGLAGIGDTPVFRTWDESAVHIGDCGIVPGSEYQLRASFDGETMSDPTTVNTADVPAPKYWADMVGGFVGDAWLGPNGIVNMSDIQAALQRFSGSPSAPPLTWVDLDSETPNGLINMTDIQQAVGGFKGMPYPFGDPVSCP